MWCTPLLLGGCRQSSPLCSPAVGVGLRVVGVMGPFQMERPVNGEQADNSDLRGNVLCVRNAMYCSEGQRGASLQAEAQKMGMAGGK